MSKLNKLVYNIDQSDPEKGGFTDAEKAQLRKNIGAASEDDIPTIDRTQPDWNESDASKIAYIKNKPIEILKWEEPTFSEITTILNSDKLVMTDAGHVFVNTSNQTHYFMKLITNIPNMLTDMQAGYEILSIDSNNIWTIYQMQYPIVSREDLRWAFDTDPSFEFKIAYNRIDSIRLTQSPLIIADPDEIDGYDVSKITIENNKITKVKINVPTLEIDVRLFHKYAGFYHSANFVIEVTPECNCDITIMTTTDDEEELNPTWTPLYCQGQNNTCSTSATLEMGHNYQIKATGSYWTVTDFGLSPPQQQGNNE